MQVKLADPDIVSNPSEYQKVAQSVAELDEVVHICCFLCFLFGKHVKSIEIILFYKTPYVYHWNWQVVLTYRRFKDCEKQLEETKGYFYTSPIITACPISGKLISLSY